MRVFAQRACVWATTFSDDVVVVVVEFNQRTNVRTSEARIVRARANEPKGRRKKLCESHTLSSNDADDDAGIHIHTQTRNTIGSHSSQRVSEWECVGIRHGSLGGVVGLASGAGRCAMVAGGVFWGCVIT